MSKNELRVIARIVLIGTGLYVLLHTIVNNLSGILTILTVGFAGQHKSMIITSIVLNTVLMLAAVYFLARVAGRFSAKIVESAPEEDTQISWLAVAFRLVCVSAGVLFLYWSAPNLIKTLIMYMSMKSGQQFMMYSKFDIIKYIILLAVSIYFAWGAPGFVRWQVKRTIRQCNKTIEQQPAWR